MIPNWGTIRIAKLVEAGWAEIRTGPFGTQLRASDYSETGVPVLNVRNLGYGTIREAHLERVESDVQSRLSGHLLRENDLVFGRKGAVDRHVRIRTSQDGWMQGSDCIRLRTTDASPVSPEFLSACLSTDSHKRWMERQCSHGATMASLNQEILGRIVIGYPSLRQQERITSIIGAFDELIEINERRIELLEDLARSLYREWFVHFRFPGHENEKFKESEIGPMPNSWMVTRVGDVLDLAYGKALPGKARVTGSVPVVSSAGVIDSHNKSIVNGPGVVLGRKGNAGSVWWIDEDFFPIDTTFYVESDLPMAYSYWALRDLNFIDSHAAVPGLSRDQVYAQKVVVPPVDLMKSFADLDAQFRRRQQAMRRVVSNMTTLRELLLPRLVTGKLDISDIDLGILEPEEVA